MGIIGPLGEVPVALGSAPLGDIACGLDMVMGPSGAPPGGLDPARCVASILALGANVCDTARMLGVTEDVVEDIMMDSGYKDIEVAVGGADRRTAGEILRSVEVSAVKALVRILQDPRSGPRELKSAASDILDRWQGKPVIRQETVFTEIDRDKGLEGLSDAELDNQLSAVEDRLGIEI